MTARTFIDPAQTNRVGLIVEAPDSDTFRRALESKEAAEAMQHDGVRPDRVQLLPTVERTGFDSADRAGAIVEAGSANGGYGNTAWPVYCQLSP
jgi:hypothetical protein